MAGLGPERVIAPAATPRAVARNDEAIAVVTSSAVVLTGFDGTPLRTIVSSDTPSTAAAVASDGHSFLVTWLTGGAFHADRKSTRLNSSHSSISYAVFCLKKKKNKQYTT